MQITLKSKDIKNTYSASGCIIDELAYTSGFWTYDDMQQNNFDYEFSNNDYIIEHFNFEDALLKETRTIKQYDALCKELELTPALNLNAKMKHIGAFVALNYPEQYGLLLRAYIQKCKEEIYNPHDSKFLDAYAWELRDEVIKGIDSFWDSMTDEWLNGDRYDFGVLGRIKKYWEVDEVIFDSKNWDEITLVIDDEQLHANYCGCDTGCDYKNYKQDLLASIESHAEHKHNKEMAEREKRIAERKATQEYQAKRKAEVEAERINKLKALTK